ncbi:MAG: hypothetical protein HYU86_12985 [Chloroflexi bacterium]|nr:hypothetical protein [Chloroflexota bacterium]
MEKSNYWNDILSRRIGRRSVLKGAIALAGLGLVACAPAAGPGAPAGKALTKLTFASPDENGNLDTHLDTGGAGGIVYPNIYDALTYRAKNNSPTLTPQLALSWEAPDATTWIFKLRKGVTFHNGEPFNAQVVKFNLERLKDPESKSRWVSEYAGISQVEVVDDYTVKVVSKNPDPLLINKLPGSRIVAMKIIQEKGQNALAANPIGTGPYQFVQWKKDDFQEYKANESYWRVKPHIGTFIYRPIPEEVSRGAAVKSGQADLTYALSVDSEAELKREPNIGMSKAPSNSLSHFGFGYLEDSPLKDKRVRQAINYAVNWDSIIKNLFLGNAVKMPSAVPATFGGANPNQKPYPYDLKKAKDLLAAAGYSKGFEMDFNYHADFAKAKELFQAVQSDLQTVGIKTNFKVFKDSAYQREQFTAKKGPLGITYFGRVGRMLHAYEIVARNLHSKGSSNYFSYSNPDMDRLIDKATIATSVEAAQKAWAETLDFAKEEAVWLFGFQEVDIYAFDKRKLSIDASEAKWTQWMLNVKVV